MKAMRTAFRSVFLVIGIAVTVVAWPSGMGLAATSVPQGDFAIASILPTAGHPVGVAHPVVVTFSRPVVDRHAAERAIGVKSAPAMTGKFEWLDNIVVQWVPARWHFRWVAGRRNSKQVQSSSVSPTSQTTPSP
jgi:lipoprotein-anchoring transpeptidase ErfK/SrfK